MMIASILHVFDIHPIVGEDGTKFDPQTEFLTGLISCVSIFHFCCTGQAYSIILDRSGPTRVPCTVTPRSKSAECLIHHI